MSNKLCSSSISGLISISYTTIRTFRVWSNTSFIWYTWRGFSLHRCSSIRMATAERHIIQQKVLHIVALFYCFLFTFLLLITWGGKNLIPFLTHKIICVLINRAYVYFLHLFSIRYPYLFEILSKLCFKYKPCYIVILRIRHEYLEYIKDSFRSSYKYEVSIWYNNLKCISYLSIILICLFNLVTDVNDLLLSELHKNYLRNKVQSFHSP